MIWQLNKMTAQKAENVTLIRLRSKMANRFAIWKYSKEDFRGISRKGEFVLFGLINYNTTEIVGN